MADLILTAILAVGGLAWLTYGRIRAVIQKPALASANFVTFNAQPVLLYALEQDMRDAGWKLVATSAREEAMLYRFEKDAPTAASLVRILAAEGVMQRIANRTEGSDVLLKVEDFGSRRANHA